MERAAGRRHRSVGARVRRAHRGRPSRARRRGSPCCSPTSPFGGWPSSIGAGWLARAERLLETAPESATHAWLQVLYTVMALMQSRLGDAVGHADRAMELARDHGNPDAHGLALSLKGMAEIARGTLAGGSVVGRRGRRRGLPRGRSVSGTASDIYCNTIAACRDLGDYARAGQWTDEAERWMRRAVGRRLSGDLPGPSRRAEDAARSVAGGGAGSPPCL